MLLEVEIEFEARDFSILLVEMHTDQTCIRDDDFQAMALALLESQFTNAAVLTDLANDAMGLEDFVSVLLCRNAHARVQIDNISVSNLLTELFAADELCVGLRRKQLINFGDSFPVLQLSLRGDKSFMLLDLLPGFFK